jgi:predicted nucleic acid-binding protein
MFLLDTNVVSELGKASRADANVTAWFAQTEPPDLHVSAITILEL